MAVQHDRGTGDKPINDKVGNERPNIERVVNERNNKF